MKIKQCHAEDLLKGLAAGVVAGLGASWVMNQFQALVSRKVWGNERSHGAQSQQQGSPHRGIARELEKRGTDKEEDDSTIRVAKAVSEFGFGHKLKESDKETAGAIAHYAMGAASGAIYGTMAEVMPVTTVGAGVPFGAAVWLVADEAIIPALGLSKKTTEYPLSVHVYALASHLVYGVTTEIARKMVRNALNGKQRRRSLLREYLAH